MSKKIIVILLLIVFAAIIVYFVFGRNKTPEKDFFVVEKQNLAQEISVVGKIRPVESVNLAFERTGVLNNLFVEVGQKIEKGTLLAQLDTGDAEKRIKDAQVNLENAKLTLDKINLQQKQLLRGDILNKSYEDGLTILASFYDQTTAILNSLDNILFGKTLDENKENIEYYVEYEEKFSGEPARLKRLYQEAKEFHKEALINYQWAERGSGDTRNKAINSGQNLALKLAEIIKSTKDIIRHLQDYFTEESLIHDKQSMIDNHAKTLAQYDSIIDGYLKNLTVIINTVNDYNDRLELLSLDIKNQELIVKQRENELIDAKNNLAKYFLYSPFNATVVSLNLKKGEVITANIPVIKLISSSQFEIVADIYEEDIVKIKIGAPVKITLPAFPKETFEGSVIFIDEAEKIIDGVVYYETKIVFHENPPEAIKTTMSADLIIQVDFKENALVVPRGAIKRVGDKMIVGVLVDNLIQEREVKIGLRGDEMTEIISGLTEGEKVILW